MEGKDLRIVFMGTPEFAVASLRRLVEEGYNIVAVVTTPDKPAGRGQKIHESDVKVAARELGLPILQPEKLRDPEFVEAMQALQPDLGIVIAFRMLPEIIWSMPKYGTFNLHASLLPQYRGAAPINWAIINGEKETGITTFLLNHEIDKGAIIGQQRMPILPEDNIGTMYDKLMTAGCDLVVDTVEHIAAEDYTPIEQMHIDEATLRPAPKIFKEDCKIDWSWNGERIVNFVRGLSPYPAAWTEIVKVKNDSDTQYDNDNKKNHICIKIYNAEYIFYNITESPGTIKCNNKDIYIACSNGWIKVTDLQMANKRRMSANNLLLGFKHIHEYCCCTWEI